MSDIRLKLAKKFYAEDMPSASIPHSRLSNLLTSLSQSKPISHLGLHFLTENGLKNLAQFIAGEISEAEFHQLAPIEQTSRIAAAAEQQKILEQQRQAKKEAFEARHAAMMAELKAKRIRLVLMAI